MSWHCIGVIGIINWRAFGGAGPVLIRGLTAAAAGFIPATAPRHTIAIANRFKFPQLI